MATKIELFRQLNSRAPEVVEQLIRLWGTGELCVYVRNALKYHTSEDGTPVDLETLVILPQVLDEHDREFPQFADPNRESGASLLADNEYYLLVLARVPRIAQRIDALWGRAGFSDYVHHLMNDSRDGTRQGFPADIALALLKLMHQHDKEFPQFIKQVSDIWSLNNKLF